MQEDYPEKLFPTFAMSNRSLEVVNVHKQLVPSHIYILADVDTNTLTVLFAAVLLMGQCFL